MNKVDELAILYRQDEMIWRVCDNLRWPSKLGKLYRAIDEKKNKYIIDNFQNDERYFDTQISGYAEGTSHYDIDDALKMEFGERINCDSESGAFFSYCKEENIEKISNFLKENFEGLEFNVIKRKNPKLSIFVNWSSAERYVRERNLKANKVSFDKEIVHNILRDEFNEKS